MKIGRVTAALATLAALGLAGCITQRSQVGPLVKDVTFDRTTGRLVVEQCEVVYQKTDNLFFNTAAISLREEGCDSYQESLPVAEESDQ